MKTTAATLGKAGVRTFNLMSNLDFLSIPLGKYVQNNLDSRVNGPVKIHKRTGKQQILPSINSRQLSARNTPAFHRLHHGTEIARLRKTHILFMAELPRNITEPLQ